MSTALRSYWRGADLLTMRDEVAGVNRHYHFDHQGTTQALTGDNGAVTDRFSSDAWGVQVKRTGSSMNRQWYVGSEGYQRSEAPLDYVRERQLVPARGAWLSCAPDARGFEHSHASQYQYVSNRPSVLAAPRGLQAQQPAPAFCTGCPPAPGTPAARIDEGSICYFAGEHLANAFAKAILESINGWDRQRCLCDLQLRIKRMTVHIESGCWESTGLPKPILENGVLSNQKFSCTDKRGRARANCASIRAGCAPECKSQPVVTEEDFTMALPPGTVTVRRKVPLVGEIQVKLADLVGTVKVDAIMTRIWCVGARSGQGCDYTDEIPTAGRLRSGRT